jgi:hypothetical protein
MTSVPPLITGDCIYRTINTANLLVTREMMVPMISGLDAPINPSDAANKAYVDSKVGLSPGMPFNSIQINDNGILGGSPNLLFNTDTITLIGNFINEGTSDSISSTTGSVVTHGGLGVAKNVVIGEICTATKFYTSSDIRLKKDIKKIEGSILDNISFINGYSYKLINNDKLSYGFLADELENNGMESFVEKVDNYKRVSYQDFIPILLEKIKILEERVKVLEQ